LDANTSQTHSEQSSGFRLPEGVATLVETMTHNAPDKPKTNDKSLRTMDPVPIVELATTTKGQ